MSIFSSSKYDVPPSGRAPGGRSRPGDSEPSVVDPGHRLQRTLSRADPPGDSANHRLAQLKAVALRELRHEKLLLPREGHCFRDNALAACRKARITPNAVFESDQFASIFALVAAGAGVSLVPAMAVEGAKGCSLLPVEPESSRRIGYALVRRKFRPSAQKAFIEWLRRSVRPLRPARS